MSGDAGRWLSTVIRDLSWYEYDERNSKKEDLFAYYDYMTDEQKRECLSLYLFYQEVPAAVENKIKNSLKNPEIIIHRRKCYGTY